MAKTTTPVSREAVKAANGYFNHRIDSVATKLSNLQSSNGEYEGWQIVEIDRHLGAVEMAFYALETVGEHSIDADRYDLLALVCVGLVEGDSDGVERLMKRFRELASSIVAAQEAA